MSEKKTNTRNFWSLVMEGSLSLGGFKFFGTETVTPMFVIAMGGDEALLGFIITLTSFVPSLINLFVGPYTSYIKNQARYCTWMMVLTRPLPLLIMPLVLLLDLHPMIALVAFTVSYIGMRAGNGLVITPWEDLFARVMSPKDRDRVYDYQLFIGGAFGVLCGFLVSTLMNIEGMGQNLMYTILFGLGGLFNGLSAISMGMVKDTPNRTVKTMPENRLEVLQNYYRGIFRYWGKNKEFRKLYYCEILRNLASWLFPFIILMGSNVYGLTEGQISILVIGNVVGGILSGITWRAASEKWGPKGVIIASYGMLISIPVLLVVSLLNNSIAFILVLLIQVMMGHISNDWVGYSNYTLTIINDEERPEYLVFHSLLKLPFSFVSMIAGAVSAAFGYWPLAIITLIMGIAGLTSVKFFKK